MKVWIIKDGGHDYGDASNFGEIDMLFEQRVYPFGKAKELEEDLNRRPVCRDDYFLPSGSLMLNLIAFNWWKEKFGRVKILMFNAKTSKYVECVL